MKTKKLLIIVLSMVLCLGLFTACTSTQPTTAPAEPTEAASEPATEPEQTATEPEEPALDYPKSTITIINPYSAGGNTDIVARLIADELSKDLGVSVIVDNRSGGAGAVGMLSCATSPADGYTLAICANGAATITPNTSDVGYTVDSFERIAQVIEQPNLFCVSKSLGVSTWDEYVEYVKNNPNTSYSTAGATSLANLQITAIFNEAGIAPIHVPADGGAAAVTNALGGHVDGVVTVPGEVAQYLDAGDMVALLCSTSERATSYPDVPTAKELGFSVSSGVWTGFVCPVGVDERIVDFLSDAIHTVLMKPAVEEAISNIGSTVCYTNAEEFDAMYVNEYNTMSNTLKELGLTN